MIQPQQSQAKKPVIHLSPLYTHTDLQNLNTQVTEKILRET